MQRTRWPLVLVVEDDDNAARMLSDALADERFRVVVADDGDEALTECAIEEPDVILLDLKLKQMHGDAFLERYRRRHGANARIIVVTGQTHVDERALGVDAVIGKPFDLADLLERVRRATGRELAG